MLTHTWHDNIGFLEKLTERMVVDLKKRVPTSGRGTAAGNLLSKGHPHEIPGPQVSLRSQRGWETTSMTFLLVFHFRSKPEAGSSVLAKQEKEIDSNIPDWSWHWDSSSFVRGISFILANEPNLQEKKPLPEPRAEMFHSLLTATQTQGGLSSWNVYSPPILALFFLT